MPGRKVPLINDQIYHVLNRGISLQPTFKTIRELNRAIEVMRYYQSRRPPLRYSQFVFLSNERRNQILDYLSKEKDFLVEIICFCMMPNHFHFMLKQLEEDGISKFVSNFTNSFTRYFNVKEKRKGPLFQGKFEAVRVETDEQLVHLSRYIHLNPFSSYVVKTFKELENYSYSSLPEYLGRSQTNFCEKEIVLNQFRYPKLYQKFIFDQKDYQRKLEKIKHLALDEENTGGVVSITP